MHSKLRMHAWYKFDLYIVSCGLGTLHSDSLVSGYRLALPLGITKNS